MSPAPTQSYFGRYPTSVILQTTDNFTGSQQTNLNAALSGGISLFPAQSGGGLYNFHTDTIQIKSITYYGSGSLAVYKVINGNQTLITTLTSPNTYSTSQFALNPNEFLKFVSTGSAGTQAVEVIGNLSQGQDTL